MNNPIIRFFSRITESSQAYLFLARNAFLTAVNFRLKTVFNILSDTIQIIVQVLLWFALFDNGRVTGNVRLEDMVSYTDNIPYCRYFQL